MFLTSLLYKFPTLYHTQIHSFYKFWVCQQNLEITYHPFLIKICYSKYKTKTILHYREFKISMYMPSIWWTLKKQKLSESRSTNTPVLCKSSAWIPIHSGPITATLPFRVCSKPKILFLIRTFGINRDKIHCNRKELMCTTFQNTHSETAT